MTAHLRVAPASASQLAADSQSPAIVFIKADRALRDRLAIATSRIGLGIDLSGEQIRIAAGRLELELLRAAIGEDDTAISAELDAYLRPVPEWRLRTRSLPLDRPHVMGIVNLTEDSFSGDGIGADVAGALKRAEALRVAGASIIDVGAESARADRPVMDEAAEAELVARAVEALVADGHCLSVDTYKGAVARSGLAAGAEVINDISGLTQGMDAARAALEANAGYVLNYSYSVPKRRPDSPPMYTDVVAETVAWMGTRIELLAAAGMTRGQVAIDPGIAFGKSHDEDIQMLRRIGELTTFGLPVLLAHSRKNFIGSVNRQPPTDRDIETQVLSAMAYEQGVRIFRVHDVAGTRRAVEMAAAVTSNGPGAFAPDAGSWPWRAGADAAHMTRGGAQGNAPAGQRW